MKRQGKTIPVPLKGRNVKLSAGAKFFVRSSAHTQSNTHGHVHGKSMHFSHPASLGSPGGPNKFTESTRSGVSAEPSI